MVRVLDKKIVEQAVRDRRMLTMTTNTYFAEERVHIDAILDHFLAAAGRPELEDKLAYCIHELANNAKKANTKRVYFLEKNLDLEDESQYWIGMRHFRRETVENIDYYQERLKQRGLHIKVQFKLDNGVLTIAIRNNVRLTRIERNKIEEKIARSRTYATLADAYASIEDTSEGAGLGIVMMIIMLRNLGMSERIIRFFSHDSETVVLLTIPATCEETESHSAAIPEMS
jgi:hypothetical protein